MQSNTTSTPAFPLQWPAGWKRTAQRRHSRYRGANLINAKNGILHSIRLMNGHGTLLEALRQLERTGASQILERAFTGFAALPASTHRPWRAVLEISGATVSHEEVKSAFRRLARIRHPDVPTGSHAAMLELSAAQAYALAELRNEDLLDAFDEAEREVSRLRAADFDDLIDDPRPRRKT